MSNKSTHDFEKIFDLLHANELDDLEARGTQATRSIGSWMIYPSSIRWFDGALYCLLTDGLQRSLVTLAQEGKLPSDAKGARSAASGVELDVQAISWESYLYLKERFPYVAPVSLRDRKTTIGTGDRLGLATPGHIRAVRSFPVAPVLAQQSIRELNLTGRNYRGVVADAGFGVFQEGFEGGYGADGDHLKTIDDINTALEADMPMITLDLTEVMDPAPSEWSPAAVESGFEDLDSDIKRFVLEYADKRFDIEGEIVIPRIEAMRCGLMYWRAIEFAGEVDTHIRRHRGDAYDLEISIDETEAPTHPAHHLFIARELERRGVTVNSVAPRFIGEFQKGIDYIGDLDQFEKQFEIHARIARFHDYKISVHSGSDKFSVYPTIGKYTGFKVHVKTAGTSWLEAVRTVSNADPDLYRLMHAKAYVHFPEATKLYHITADLGRIPKLDELADEGLSAFLEQNESRQLLHVTYGGLLNDSEVRERFFRFLSLNEESHYKTVSSHIRRHVETLGIQSADG